MPRGRAVLKRVSMYPNAGQEYEGFECEEAR